MIYRPNLADPGRIVAHRGASLAAPENTLAAFRAAADQGARWIEFDVSLLGDGTPVLHHDATLDRCTNRQGALADLTARNLQGIDCGNGEPLATLDEALDVIADLDLFANLEMKPHGDPEGHIAGVVSAMLEARPWTLNRVIVSSFWEGELDWMRKRMPKQALAALFFEPPENWTNIVDRLGAAAVHVKFAHLTSGLITAVRRRGMDIRTFTINDPVAATPFRDHGLTGVITDHPPFYLDDPAWRDWAAG